MSTALDTAEDRIAEYGRLFERALVRRERGDGRVVFTFRADPGVRATVDDLARREAACCPFADYRVESAGDEVIWTIASVDEMVDAFYALGGSAQPASTS